MSKIASWVSPHICPLPDSFRQLGALFCNHCIKVNKMHELVSYKGFCVGGPLDGHWVSEISRDIDVDGFCYRHVQINDLAEFWIPEDKDETWAFMQLIRSHRAMCDPRATLHLLDRVRHHAYRSEAIANQLLAALMKKPVSVPFMGTGTVPIQPMVNTGFREAE